MFKNLNTNDLDLKNYQTTKLQAGDYLIIKGSASQTIQFKKKIDDKYVNLYFEDRRYANSQSIHAWRDPKKGVVTDRELFSNLDAILSVLNFSIQEIPHKEGLFLSDGQPPFEGELYDERYDERYFVLCEQTEASN